MCAPCTYHYYQALQLLLVGLQAAVFVFSSASAETHPRTLELMPGEEIMWTVTITAGRAKESSLPNELG